MFDILLYKEWVPTRGLFIKFMGKVRESSNHNLFYKNHNIQVIEYKLIVI